MEKKELDLVKLTITEDGDVFTRIYRPLRNDLNNEQLDRILGYMNKVAKTIEDKTIEELEGEME